MTLYEERLNRINQAIALEPVDKIPVISGAASFHAVAVGVTMKDYLSDMELNCTTNLKALELMGNIDGVQVMLVTPEGLPTLWLSEVKVPGRELPDESEWQVHEKELITHDDYREIVKNGFADWYFKFMKEKLGDPLSRLKPVKEYGPIAKKRFVEAGVPCIKGTSLLTPFEMFCGGRSLTTFFMEDLIGAPDLLEEVFKVTHEFNMNKYIKLFESDAKPYGVWVGGWRGTPSMLSPEMFERFSWKYYKELVDLCIQYHVVPIMHLDSCWDLGLKYFKEFPAGKGVMALDGKTNIFEAKEVVGDSMCIMGDVPAELLAFGKKEEVYDYVTERIKRIGPTGYMICSGCDIPYNAKLENVQMMSKAADDAAKA